MVENLTLRNDAFRWSKFAFLLYWVSGLKKSEPDSKNSDIFLSESTKDSSKKFDLMSDKLFIICTYSNSKKLPSWFLNLIIKVKKHFYQKNFLLFLEKGLNALDALDTADQEKLFASDVYRIYLHFYLRIANLKLKRIFFFG